MYQVNNETDNDLLAKRASPLFHHFSQDISLGFFKDIFSVYVVGRLMLLYERCPTTRTRRVASVSSWTRAVV